MTSDKTTRVYKDAYLIDSENNSYKIPEGDDANAFLMNVNHVGNSVCSGKKERHTSYKGFIALRKDPERSIESFLEAQMIVAGNKSAELLRRACWEEENLSRLDNWNKIAMHYKYADKFQHRAMQLAETIMKIRRGASQKIVVEKINIDGGSQAVIGNVRG
jgi:hypothetical protein